MKAVISSTHDDKYLYFLPIVTFLWNKLGVDVICFFPLMKDNDWQKWGLIAKYFYENNFRNQTFQFACPEHKEATYAQCSRLYAACLDLPEDEILITSDCDMGLFKKPIDNFVGDRITSFGFDLVPEGQLPMCYAGGTVKGWRNIMGINGRTYQQCLDDLLGGIDCENMRGNYWSRDQEELNNRLFGTKDWFLIARAKPGTQFADNRVDRDDINWRSYLNENLIDAHLWRPGYTDENFPKIMELMTTMYPNEDFTWLVEYTNQYKKLL